MVRWTWWDWSLSLGLLLPSVLWHCWLGHLTRKNPSPVPDMTHNVFSGTLNPTQSKISALMVGWYVRHIGTTMSRLTRGGALHWIDGFPTGQSPSCSTRYNSPPLKNLCTNRHIQYASLYFIKAKLHYACWFEAGSKQVRSWFEASSKLVADRFEAGRWQASNLSATSFERASVMEFGIYHCTENSKETDTTANQNRASDSRPRLPL